jgi:hypothetical protein
LSLSIVVDVGSTSVVVVVRFCKNLKTIQIKISPQKRKLISESRFKPGEDSGDDGVASVGGAGDVSSESDMGYGLVVVMMFST